MASDDSLKLDGVVESASKDKYKVRVTPEHVVTCTLSGKIRQNSVRIVEGDRVTIEVSAYDMSNGRIVFRLK